jgi:hypothetical protein
MSWMSLGTSSRPSGLDRLRRVPTITTTLLRPTTHTQDTVSRTTHTQCPATTQYRLARRWALLPRDHRNHPHLHRRYARPFMLSDRSWARTGAGTYSCFFFPRD